MDGISKSNEEVDSNFEGRTVLEKLSRPKIWAATAVTVGLAGIVTAAVALTIPAAAAVCTIAALTLAGASVFLGAVAITIHILAKRANYNRQSIFDPNEQYQLIRAGCVDDYRIGILKGFCQSERKLVIDNGNFNVDFLEVLKQFEVDIIVKIFHYTSPPTTEKLKMLANFTHKIQSAIYSNHWFDMDSMRTIQSFSTPVQNALADFQYETRHYFDYYVINKKPIYNDAASIPDFSNEWFFEMLSSLDDEAKIAVLTQKFLNAYDMVALVGFSNEIRCAIIKKGWLNQNIIYRLPSFSSKILDILLHHDCSFRELDMLSRFSEDVQIAIIENDCFDKEKMELLEKLPAAMKANLIEANLFDWEKIEILAHLSPKAWPMIVCNGIFNEKMAAALKPFDQAVQAAIVDAKFFDEDQLRLLAELHPKVQLAVLANRRKIAKFWAPRDGKDQDGVPPNRCLNESFIKKLQRFDENTQERIILGQCVSPKNLEIAGQLSLETLNFLLRERFFTSIVPSCCWRLECWEDFEPKDIQLFLRHFGHKIVALSLYANHLSEIDTIDLSQCTKLKFLHLYGVENLRDITGLWKCVKLKFIHISGGSCKTFVKKLMEIPREDISITWHDWPKATGCEGPALWKQFAPHGDWYEFFKDHPQAKLTSSLQIQDTNESGQHFLVHLPNFCYMPKYYGSSYLSIQPNRGTMPEYNLAPDLVGKVQIESLKEFSEDQIAMLKKFRYETQVFIYNQGLLDKTAANFKWGSYRLDHFRPEEIQRLLGLFGPKFRELNFRCGDTVLKSLGLSNCSNLEQLILNGQVELRRIKGLDGCKSLWLLDLAGCRHLHRAKTLAELQKIKAEEIFIQCADSSLQIQNETDLEKQCGGDGDWNHFLRNHPRSIVYNLLTEELSQSLDRNRPPSAIPGYFLSSTLLGNGTRSETKSDAPYELAQGLEGKITDPKQIALLKQCNPGAQRIIVDEKLFDEKTENLEWDAQLQYFQPKEIQPLLDNFGQKYQELNFSGYVNLPEAIDLSHCSKLRSLHLDHQPRLQRISGLSSCSRLQSLYLDGCTALDEDRIIGELTQLACPSPCISFYDSNLVIQGKAMLSEKFAPNGKWGQFLESHPNARLDNLLEDESGSDPERSAREPG